MMNEKSETLNLQKTHWAVAHGMHHDNNYSSAYDISKLSCFAMENQYFRDVVGTQNRECRSKKYPGHVYKWENTNFLLKEGYDGIKTGITPSAGPCLAAAVKKDGFRVCVIVLSCCSPESRWLEVPKLVTWGTKKIKKI